MAHAPPVHQQTHASSHHHRLKCCGRETETKGPPLGPHLACQKSAGIYALTALIFKILSGPIVDTYNKRHVGAITMGIMALSFFGYALSTNVPMLISSRLIQGVGQAFTSTCLISNIMTKTTIVANMIMDISMIKAKSMTVVINMVVSTIANLTKAFSYWKVRRYFFYGLSILFSDKLHDEKDEIL